MSNGLHFTALSRGDFRGYFQPNFADNLDASLNKHVDTNSTLYHVGGILPYLIPVGGQAGALGRLALKTGEGVLSRVLTRLALRGAEDAAGAATRQTLYHYTSEAGYKGIARSGSLNASGADVPFGPGQFLTDIAPERVLAGPKSAISAEQQAQGFMSRWQLSQQLFTTPWKAPQLTHFLEIDVSGLDILNPRPGTFLIPGESPLDLTGRIVRGGGF